MMLQLIQVSLFWSKAIETLNFLTLPSHPSVQKKVYRGEVRGGKKQYMGAICSTLSKYLLNAFGSGLVSDC